MIIYVAWYVVVNYGKDRRNLYPIYQHCACCRGMYYVQRTMWYPNPKRMTLSQ